jgi:hypothetical protein
VQAEPLERRNVLMVRRRSTVRFRKGASRSLGFSKSVAIPFAAFVERVVETLYFPLYTYIGDTAPGQARGNNLTLYGGLWHEVRVSR